MKPKKSNLKRYKIMLILCFRCGILYIDKGTQNKGEIKDYDKDNRLFQNEY